MTQPVQEPTQGRTDQAQEFRTRQLFRRPPLVNPTGSGGYLQAKGVQYLGTDFDLLTNNGTYTGGNGADWTDGSWVVVDDADCPFEQRALTTDTDGDWFPFPVGNLGPQGTGYGVAVWFKGAPTDGSLVNIEWATTGVDEAGITTGPKGSDTSVPGWQDFAFWDAPLPSWYNNDSLGEPSFRYQFDTADAAAGWTVAVYERSNFYLDGVDGTMLTANGGGFGDWENSHSFNGGGGPDVWWWMRLRIAGADAGTGFSATIGKVKVYRLNGTTSFVGAA